MAKIRVMVLYGGRSGEHEISLQSARSVINNLDRSKFEVVPVAIDKDGRWLFHDVSLIENAKRELPVFKNAPEVAVVRQSSGGALVPIKDPGKPLSLNVDVVFPVMHGPLCEDGTVQGLLELAGLPYVGSGVLGSAIGMDKEVAKRLCAAAGIPIASYVTAKKRDWERDKNSIEAEAKRRLPLPVFVKPANMGSSVGVHKVKTWSELKAALTDAFQYDEKVLIEQGIDAREIEVAVLESPEFGESHITGIPGEVKPAGNHEFYSYESKYLDENGAELILPAKLSAAEQKNVREIAVKIFETLELNDMARVDFLMDRKTGTFYFNEVNTIPGFTSISMYPKMMEAAGISYAELLTKLVNLAAARFERRKKLKRDYSE
jgi:D-alanine-D-alanine ligase